MRIGILGSYFNPLHLGHLLVAEQCLAFAGFDKVWFLPGFKSTFNKELIPASDRLNMIRLVQLPYTEVSTLEIDHKLDGNTINLIPYLQKLYPKDQFTFIIGSDQLPEFHRWGNWQELLKQLPFLVFPRAGYPNQPLYPGMKLLEHKLLVVTNISSTLIRGMIKKGLTISSLVPNTIETYIKKHNLYI